MKVEKKWTGKNEDRYKMPSWGFFDLTEAVKLRSVCVYCFIILSELMIVQKKVLNNIFKFEKSYNLEIDLINFPKCQQDPFKQDRKMCYIIDVTQSIQFVLSFNRLATNESSIIWIHSLFFVS